MNPNPSCLSTCCVVGLGDRQQNNRVAHLLLLQVPVWKQALDDHNSCSPQNMKNTKQTLQSTQPRGVYTHRPGTFCTITQARLQLQLQSSCHKKQFRSTLSDNMSADLLHGNIWLSDVLTLVLRPVVAVHSRQPLRPNRDMQPAMMKQLAIGGAGFGPKTASPSNEIT